MFIRLSRRTWIAVLVLGLLFAGGVFVATRTGAPTEETEVAVVRQDLREVVSVTGRVKASESVSLAFERAGRIVSVQSSVGKRVAKGELLVSLDRVDALGSYQSALAAVASAEARYAEVAKGARPEEVAVTEARVDAARDAVASADRTLEVRTLEAKSLADDLVRTKGDLMFSNPESSHPLFNPAVTNTQLKLDVELLRFELGEKLRVFSPAQADATIALTVTYFDKLGELLAGAGTSASVSQATLDSYKAAVSSARSSIASFQSSFTAAVTARSAAAASLVSAEKELSLKKAGATPEALRRERAEVDRVKAQLVSAAAELSRRELRAPIAGVVTVQNAKPGEMISAGAPLVTVASNSYSLEVFVPEADIAKLSLGNSAEVTLDAYGSDTFFKATVVEIDPAETLTEGVATYKVKLLFSEQDSRIKSGMTANIDITTATKAGVLAIPSRAVISRDEGKFVQVLLADEKTEDRKIVTGLRDAEGFVEIVSGLDEGERVVAAPKE